MFVELSDKSDTTTNTGSYGALSGEYPLVCLQACKQRSWMEVTENEDADDGGKTHLCWAEPSVVVDPVELLQLERSHH